MVSSVPRHTATHPHVQQSWDWPCKLKSLEKRKEERREEKKSRQRRELEDTEKERETCIPSEI